MEKAPKRQLSDVVELDFLSPARVRKFFDDDWVNGENSEKFDLIKKEIEKIKKEGSPMERPSPPERLARSANDSERRRHADLKATYVATLKEYTDYKSPRFLKLELLHKYCKKLVKLHDLLMRKSKTAGVEYEIASVRAALNDKPAPRKEGKTPEPEEEYKKRLEKFNPAGFVALRSPTADLETPEGVLAEVERVRTAEPDLKYFATKDGVSKGKTRFNDSAFVVVAAYMEELTNQLIKCSIENIAKTPKKILQPDHCVSADTTEKCSLFPLISNAPHYLAVAERQKRKEVYDAARTKEKLRQAKEAKLAAQKEHTKIKRIKFVYDKFPELEVKRGFATSFAIVTAEGKGKTIYKWYGIDLEKDQSDEQKTNFKSYIDRGFKLLKRNNEMCGDNSSAEIMVSGNFKKFVSDLVIDFITRLTSQIDPIMENKKTKTINEKIVITVIKQMLLDSYPKKYVGMPLNDEHSKLLKDVERKVQLCQAHHTAMVRKEKAEAEEEEEESEDEIDVIDTTEEVVPKTNGGVQPRKKVTAI